MHWHPYGRTRLSLEDENHRYGVIDTDEFGRVANSAAVWSKRDFDWAPVPLPEACSVEEAKRLVLATAALEA